ncbi:MAG TPA: hypothetical protein VLT47_08445 [Anaeromyxobacteraceae bacterium]|nr:hypothetical protein [Anaeromyxobacteraceae bacterium]
MRKLVLFTVAIALTLPALAEAEWVPARRGAGRGKGRPPAGYVVRDAGAALAPASRPSPVRPAPRVTYGSSAFVLGVDAVPFWMGWSWGWGYYPLWPGPYYPGVEPGYRPDDAERVTARLEAYVGGATNSVAGTVALSMEGPRAGFGADVTGLSIAAPSGSALGDATLTLGGARATWTVLADAAFRMRLELGASMLSVPDTGRYAGATYANTMTFGPQLGVSGNLGLIGPFGLEGYARVTPLPVPMLDTRAAVAFRGGPLAVTAGWRVVDVNGNGVDHPEAHFAGPELGLQLMF